MYTTAKPSLGFLYEVPEIIPNIPLLSLLSRNPRILFLLCWGSSNISSESTNANTEVYVEGSLCSTVCSKITSEEHGLQT